MDDSFDGYRKWLGIPPEEQPPHHYRLLGIAVFEDDPDVIENAANRQMTHVRTFQSGRYSKLSQKILNELSTAKICLLNAKKKQDYDAQLKAKSSRVESSPASPPKAPPPKAVPPQAPPQNVRPSPSAAPPMQTSPPMGTPVQQHAPVATVAPVGSAVSPQRVGNAHNASGSPFTVPKTASAAKRARTRRKSSAWPLLLGIVSVAVLLGVVVVVANRDPQTADNVRTQNVADSNPGMTPPAPTDAGNDLAGSRNGAQPQPSPGRNENIGFSPPRGRPPNRNDSDSGFQAAPPVGRKNDEPRRGDDNRNDEFDEIVEAAMKDARQRDIESARRRLQRVNHEVLAPAQKERLGHVIQLLFRIEDVVKAARQGIGQLNRLRENDIRDSFEFLDGKIRLIGYERDQIVYDVNDRRIETSIADMAPMHVLAFATFGFETDTPEVQAKLATFLWADHQSTAGEHELARYWADRLAADDFRDPEMAWIMEQFAGEPPQRRTQEPSTLRPPTQGSPAGGSRDDRPNMRNDDEPEMDPNDPFGVEKPGENPFRDDPSDDNPFRNDPTDENPFN